MEALPGRSLSPARAGLLSFENHRTRSTSSGFSPQVTSVYRSTDRIRRCAPSLAGTNSAAPGWPPQHAREHSLPSVRFGRPAAPWRAARVHVAPLICVIY
jgi:hypothetical protein